MRLLMYVFIFTEDWAKDRARRKEAGVPKSITFQTRHQLALEMLAECGKALPHTWIAGDDEMGRPSGFRLELRALGQRYLLAVPSNTTVRDIEAPPPAYCGRGPRPKSAVRACGPMVSQPCRRMLGPGSRCVTERKDRW